MARIAALQAPNRQLTECVFKLEEDWRLRDCIVLRRAAKSEKHVDASSMKPNRLLMRMKPTTKIAMSTTFRT